MSTRLTKSLICVALSHTVLYAQPPRPRTLRAEVAIAVEGDRARVRTHFAFAGNPGALSFELLQQPCAEIGLVRMQSSGARVALAREFTEPWLRLHDTSAVDPGRDSLDYIAHYDVALRSSRVSVPVLLPVALLRGRGRGDPIAQVTVSGPSAMRVVVPRLTPLDEGRWFGRMVALPAAVRIDRGPPNADCAETVAGDSGHFRLIFWLLVATFALWVPTYLWWANRQRQPT